MVIVGFFSWWYGAGWRRQIMLAREKIAGYFDYFSIDLLLRTWFAPFRQISAGGVQGPIGVQIRAFFDQLVSRVIGSIVRSIMIVIGCVTILGALIIYTLKVIFWAIIPIIPIVGFVLMVLGWLPWIR